MAKIVQKGLWISIKSLDKESKKHYLTSMALFFIGALAWGIHVASVGGIDNNPVDIPYHYVKFLNRQDELMQRYHDFVFSWGAIGFLVLGLGASLISPLFAFSPTFYEFFLAFAVGSVLGGYRFYKKYLSE